MFYPVPFFVLAPIGIEVAGAYSRDLRPIGAGIGGACAGLVVWLAMRFVFRRQILKSSATRQ
ncbi:MAG: hypothetical protein DCC68_26250 [Planctomycetota bacterium]|nr:MAG: hypothetical protein DCC68_26250 [Planctomycetota bacterium]